MRALIAILAILAVVAVCDGRTITVDDDGPGDFSTIQAAIDDSNDGDTVLVADGTYTGDGNRDIDFHGKAITVKSENGPETCIIDCNGTEAEPHRGVHFQSGEDANSAIIGFTITNGYSPRECLTRPPWPCSWLGGGIRCKGTNPTISQCWITGNRADHGGGIHSDDGSPIVTDCTISGNYAWGVGGGMRLDGGSPRISYCTFSDNTAWVGGGGIYTSDTNLVATNCTFVGNSAVGDGGALYEHNSSPDVRNCIFTENTAGGDGGAVHAWSGSEPVITNCVFTGNRAMRSGGGIASKGHSDPVLTNCILRANRASKGNAISVLEYVGSVTYRSEITVNYSDVEGGYDSAYVEEGCRVNWHEGNVDADPCFADPGYWTDPCGTASEWWDDVWIDGDYHVKSQAGRWDAKEGRWTMDDVTSPCIDAGGPMTPIGLEPFPNGGVINMGAYGGTIEASKSYFGAAPCETIVAGDVNGDCRIDYSDFTILAAHWLECATPEPEPYEDYFPLSVGLFQRRHWRIRVDDRQ